MNETTELKLQAALNSKGAIKNAIEAKGVTVGNASFDQYASKINAIPTPIEEAPENDVNFYDYDGFRLASYTIAEAKALTQAEYNAILPPTHNGLTFQEWNWPLSDITSYNRRYIDIGANYITTDGKTRLKIVIEQNDVVVTFRGISGTMSLDWGDGSTSESYTFPSHQGNYSFSHSYGSIGNYCIELSFVSSTNNSGYSLSNVKTATTSGWIGVAIYEILCGNYFGPNTSIPAFLNFEQIHKMMCAISMPVNASLPSFSFNSSTFKCVVIPKSSAFKTGYQHYAYSPNTKICFPKTISKINDSYNFYQGINDRVVLPECTDTTSIGSGTLTSWQVSVVSLPMSASFASAGNVINSARLSYLDIAQGWTPNVSLTLSSSTEWSADGMVRFFTNLGTTQTAITLTFGSTNLAKLTAEQKAIATDKGYTLA